MKHTWQQLGANRFERIVRAALLAVIFLLPIGSVLILSEARSEVAGARNSFAVPVIYAVEVLIILTSLLWAKLRQEADRDPGSLVPLLGLVGLAAVTVLWAPWRFLAGIGLVHLFVGFVFIYVLAHEFKDRRFLRTALWALTAGASIQAVWGIAQFLLQHDLGLWRLGESDLSPDKTGIAKVVTESGESYIRAYGSFPHPNVLAAYLAATAFWVGTVVFWKDSQRQLKTQAGYVLLLGVLGAGLLMTFSRVAIIATLIGGALVALFSWRRWRWLPPAAGIGAVITLSVALLLAPWWQGRAEIETKRETGVTNRKVGYEQAFKVIADQPLGVGKGNFVLAARSLDPGRPAYQYQPVHNAFLLLVTELGLLGGVLFVWFIYRVGRDFHRRTSRDRRERSIEFMLFSVAALLALLSLTDHFLWSLPQGLLLTGIFAAAAISSGGRSRRAD